MRARPASHLITWQMVASGDASSTVHTACMRLLVLRCEGGFAAVMEMWEIQGKGENGVIFARFSINITHLWYGTSTLES